MTKSDEYAKKITNHLIKLFDEKCEDYIPIEELGNDENMIKFSNALAYSTYIAIKHIDEGRKKHAEI